MAASSAWSGLDLDEVLVGYTWRYPAEWERHQGTWLGWPERKDVWPNEATQAKTAVTTLASLLSQYEQVTVLASKHAIQEAKTALVGLVNNNNNNNNNTRSEDEDRRRRIRVVEAELDDIWLRDTGPTFLLGSSSEGGRSNGRVESVVAGVSWTFNGWGGKFSPWNKDAKVARSILDIEGVPCFECDFVLEGGSVGTDGAGTLLVTESCLLNKNRNPNYTKESIQQVLLKRLGASKVIWLPAGLWWDIDTDGHVDNLAIFAREGLVLLAWCTEDEDKRQHTICSDALDVLNTTKDAKGRNLEVVKVPLPPPLFYTQSEAASIHGGAREEGERLAASYINLYIANDVVVVPGFGDRQADDKARNIISNVFLDHKVVQLQIGRQLALGGGNIHCITQQQPSLPHCTATASI